MNYKKLKINAFQFILLYNCFFSFYTTKVVAEENCNILVTGGAGYIGSHACKALKDAGFVPIVYDSLALGDPDSVRWGPLCIGDLLDTEKLDEIFTLYKPLAVLHFAGLRNVGESVKSPDLYYTNNVAGTINLLNTMKRHGVNKIIFSGSCTVYGPQNNPVTENDEKCPINPYAFSKWMDEQILEDYSRAYGLQYIIFRYFNVAGIDLESGLKRSIHSKNFLIPAIISSVLEPTISLKIYGSDYPTLDGTAMRDYIHIKDLVSAHLSGLKYLLENNKNEILNLGTGKGYTILEIIQMVSQVMNTPVTYEIHAKKEGDVPFAVANIEKTKKILGFIPQHSDLRSIIESEVLSLKND